ncbi:YdbH domain-containing protein [Vogesella amnigena]|uniref:YdbH domain-containing protein n=1 Tax=Vogesella amnigena TaxID=1507449 RepID=A0ABV7TWA6_9NEIS
MSQPADHTPATPPPRPPRRWRRLAVLVLTLLLLLALALLAAAWGGRWWLQQQGLQLSGLGWQQGPGIARWQWRQQGCLTAEGSGLRISDWQPLRIELQQLQLFSCPQAAKTRQIPSPPAADLPAFQLHIARLQAAALPPLALAIRQQAGHWQLQARQQQNQLQLDYQRAAGQWHATALLHAASLYPGMLGELQLRGSGRWLPGTLSAKLEADGRQLGYQGQPQRAAARLQLGLDNRQWQLASSLAQPLALPAGWQLQAGHVLQAGGDLDSVHSLQVRLLAHGPQGSVDLQLQPDHQSLQQGSGLLQLAGSTLQGRIPLRWAKRQLTLAPASLRLPQGAVLRWPQALQLPLAVAGSGRLPFRLHYQQLQLNSDDSTLRWGDGSWQWQGALTLAGKHAGYRLDGRWQGQLGPQGARGKPLDLHVQAPQLDIRASLPVDGIRPQQPQLQADIRGHYQDCPLQGKLSARQQGTRWQGDIQASSRLPFYSQGGELQLTANWQGQPGNWQLLPGSRLAIGQGMLGGVLLKPLSLTAGSVLNSDGSVGHGANGSLQLEAAGAVASRWVLPALNGRIQLAGNAANASLQLPAWRSQLQLSARRQGSGAAGSLAIDTPLSAAMSRGLDVTLQQGQLASRLQWRWDKQWQLNGNADISGLALDWGGILASGGKGRLSLAASPAGVQLHSDGPLQLALLDVGTPLQDIRLALRSDLHDWQLSDVQARVLGGSVSAGQLQWPSSAFQPVTVHAIDLAAITALQKNEQPATVQLTGRVGGLLPLQLLPRGVAVQNGLLRNEGELTLRVPPGASVRAMAQSNQAVQLALDMLSELDVNDFQATLNMAASGVLDAQVTLKGVNPKQNRQPVVLNYSHSENILELLRSLRISDDISRSVLQRQSGGGTRNPVTESKP